MEVNMTTRDDLEKAWSDCIDRYSANRQAREALKAATGAQWPWKVAEENLATGVAAPQKLLTGGSKATATASITVATGPKKTVGETLNEMAVAFYKGQRR
jgi:hypothetical protein